MDRRNMVIGLLALAAGFGCNKREQSSKSSVQLPGVSAPWEEVGIADFDSRVLNSPLPALVYFDASEGCDGADPVFLRLRKRWGKQLNVFYFRAESNPEFARQYGVDEHVVIALFQDGRMVKRIDAPTLLNPLLGPNNEVASFEAFLDDFYVAVERFANLQ